MTTLSRRLLFLSGLMTACVLYTPAESAEQPTDGRLPNIVIILVDDMGYGDPGCFNPASKIPTPHIDSLARDGMKFTDAHAPGPLCHLSRYGLMTGRYPFRTDVGRWSRHAVIEPGQLTIASLLKSRGYRTRMVGKWHLGFEENGYDQPLPGGPVDCGFDGYFGIRASTDIPPYFYIRDNHAVTPPTHTIKENHTDGWSPIQGAFWRAGGIAPDLQLHNVLPRFTSEAIHVLQTHAEEHADDPLLLYLAYPAPHTPWLPDQEFIGRSGAGLYGDFAMMVDTMVGRVLKALDDSGMRENTLVIFSSDNGPTWYEEDVERFQHDSSGGWRGMKADAWEAGHRVPFIVRWPGHVSPGTTSRQMVCFTDLLSTFAAITETTLPDGQHFDSVNILPALLGTQPDGQPLRDSLAIRSGSGLMTIRDGHWKLILGLGSGGFSKPSRIQPGPTDPAGQLYNLATDPGETTNVYAGNSERVEKMLATLKAIEQVGQ